jgi:tetratricopeptide (TPR) repeat protein
MAAANRIRSLRWRLAAAFCAALAATPPLTAEIRQGEEHTDWPAVITRLRQQFHEEPGQGRARQQLAVAYNNYGVSLGEQGLWELAAKQLEEALRLDEANQQFRQNLANIYMTQAQEAYQRHAATEAVAAIERALGSNPDLALGYALLGEIEYDRQRLKEAKAAWQRAVELDPNQDAIKKRLEQVTEELPVESKFERLSQSYFDLRYEEGLERPVGFDVRDALLEARREVGSDFSYWPKQKLVVLIYSAENFRKLREETPEWVGGQFDGKIRVPLPSAGLEPAVVRQILFHEYAHALIHDLGSGQCPLWLNEGLAEYEGRTQSPGSLARLRRARDEERLIPWPELSARFSPALSGEEVALAYEQSYSIIAYLASRYGFWRFKRLLEAVGDGQAWEQAFAEEFRAKLPRLESQWREWLPELLRTHP